MIMVFAFEWFSLTRIKHIFPNVRAKHLSDFTYLILNMSDLGISKC